MNKFLLEVKTDAASVGDVVSEINAHIQADDRTKWDDGTPMSTMTLTPAKGATERFVKERAARIFDQLDQLLKLDRSSLKTYMQTLYDYAQQEMELPPFAEMVEATDNDARLLVWLFKEAACVVVKHALPEWTL